MPRTLLLMLTGCLVLLMTGLAGADGPPEDSRKPSQPLPKQLEEMSDEISKLVIDEVQEFLDKELKRLKKYRFETRQDLDQKLAKTLKVIRDEPENARAHFEIGVLYDELNDGASAIIHSRIAERLFIQRKDVKGAAETRRNLRHYFQKYDFRPEDFVLAPPQINPGS